MTEEQLDLLELGRELRDKGIALADENAGDWWRSCADQAIRHAASTGQPFTADTIRAMGVPDLISPRAWGSRFLTAARSGLIVRVGYVQSQRPSVHAHPIAQWVGSEYATAGEAA